MRSASADMIALTRIIEKGSMAAAALDLGVTPSALSRHMARLEDRLGVRLLTRTTRHLSLTAEGQTYLSGSRDILAAIEALESGVSASKNKPRGHLRVNTGTVAGRSQIAPLLPRFFAEYPDISIDLSIADRQIDLVAENVDIAVRMGGLGETALVSRKLIDTRRIICASPDYLDRHGVPQVPADLLRHNCLTISGPSRLSHWPFVAPEGVNRMEVRGTFSSDNGTIVHEMALSGLGIVRLAEFAVAPDLAVGRLVAVLEDHHIDEPVPLWAVCLPERQRLPRVRAFIDFLVKNLPLQAR